MRNKYEKEKFKFKVQVQVRTFELDSYGIVHNSKNSSLKFRFRSELLSLIHTE